MAVKGLLWKNYLDEDWDIAFMVAELHSHVHERQVEGLLLFAERMKWPYINEVRDYTEDIYGNPTVTCAVVRSLTCTYMTGCMG